MILIIPLLRTVIVKLIANIKIINLFNTVTLQVNKYPIIRVRRTPKRQCLYRTHKKFLKNDKLNIKEVLGKFYKTI